MEIIKERTRIIFKDYTPLEKHKIEDLVGTVDKVFTYQDPDDKMICFPTGMLESVKATFPKIPIKDTSNNYWNYAYIQPVEHDAKPRNQLQVDFIKFVLENAKKKQKVAGILSPGTGKALPVNTRIPTPDGYTCMGDLQVGDHVIGSNGKPVKILGVYPQGIRDIYEITFSDGRKVKCDKEHLWSVYTEGCRYKLQTFTTNEILKDYKKYTSSNVKSGRDPYRYKYRVPLLSGPVQYHHQDVPIHPYVFGAFIGNGCLMNKSNHLILSSPDDFVPKKIARLTGYYVKCPIKNHNYDYSFYYNKEMKRCPVRINKFFLNLPGAVHYSRDKYIPDCYMYNDIETRMELLRGLMDTDGCITEADGRFNISYASTSKKLLEQIQQLIWGLGYIANIGTPDKREDKYTEGYCSQVNIRVPQRFKQQLFTHPRKLKLAQEAGLRNDWQQPFRHLLIKNIEFVGKEEATCIMVEAKDQLYLTEDFIVTHNTFMACYSAIKVGLRTLIITPTTGVKVQWAETLIDMFHVPKERVKLVMSPKDFFNVSADFVVVSQASLAVLNKTYDLEQIMKANKFGIKVIDEVQMWFHNIIKVDANSNICHNWYLTGTFGRSGDEENHLYQQMFGDLQMFREKDKAPTIFNRKPGNVYGMKPHMHVKMMWAHSGLSKEEIHAVSNSIRYSERAGKWMRYGLSVPAYTELVIPKDGTMTKFLRTVLKVVKMADEQVTYGKMLILSATVASVLVLESYVSKMFPDLKVGTIHSKNSKTTNDKVKAECDILISTVKSCGTGFDVKDLSKLVVAEQFKSWILADQVSGRLRRRDDGQDTYMWDIVDADVKQLRAWANARADVLKKKSKTFKVVDI